MKKSRILAALTVLIMVLCLFTPAYAVTEEAELRGIYGDGMLFRQLDEVNLSGTASPGKVISAELKNDEGETVKSSSAVTGADGSFCVSFTAPTGGFSEYTVEMKEDGRCSEFFPGWFSANYGLQADRAICSILSLRQNPQPKILRTG